MSDMNSKDISSAVAVLNSEGVKTVTNALITLFDNRDMLWAHIKSLTDRLTRLEGELDRVSRAEHAIHCLESRIENTHADLSNLSDDVRCIEERPRVQPVGLCLEEGPFTPQLQEAMAAITKSIKS